MRAENACDALSVLPAALRLGTCSTSEPAKLRFVDGVNGVNGGKAGPPSAKRATFRPSFLELDFPPSNAAPSK